MCCTGVVSLYDDLRGQCLYMAGILVSADIAVSGSRLGW